MSFKKDVILYKKKDITIYINQCFNSGKKTRLFTVRRDDKTGIAQLIGAIKWDGGWWQYVLIPEPNTKWNAECSLKIADFLTKITKEQRKSWKT